MFNLFTLVDSIKKVAKAQPNVNTSIDGDIYRLNDIPDIEYSVFCLTQNQHRVDSDYYYYGFTLFYVDRLLADESNKLQIQSHGIGVLKNVLDTLENSLSIILSDYTFQTFNQRFADLCAGVFTQVTVQIPIDCIANYSVLVDPILAEATFIVDGEYDATQYGADGFRKIKVSGAGTSDDYYTKSDVDALLSANTENDVESAVESAKTYTDEAISNIDIPTKTSQLENDSDFITSSALTETLSGYTKSGDTYSKSEVDKKIEDIDVPTKTSELTNDSGFITGYTETDPVWNSEKGNYVTTTALTNTLSGYTKSGDTYSKSEVDKKIEDIDIPTKTSELENDSNFITSAYTYSKSEIDDKIGGIEVPKKTSQLTNDSGFITESSITSAVTSAISAYTYDKSTIDVKISGAGGDGKIQYRFGSNSNTTHDTEAHTYADLYNLITGYTSSTTGGTYDDNDILEKYDLLFKYVYDGSAVNREYFAQCLGIAYNYNYSPQASLSFLTGTGLLYVLNLGYDSSTGYDWKLDKTNLLTKTTTSETGSFDSGGGGGGGETKTYNVVLTLTDGTTETDNYPDGIVSYGAYLNRTDIVSAEIQSGITEIYSWAFNGCTNLTSVTISNSVKNIMGGVFDGCTSLLSATIPSSVESIGGNVFNGCTSLTSVTIYASVTKLDTGTFDDCVSLTSVTIPSSVTVISSTTFSDCTSLTSITIPSGVTYIGDMAFRNCKSLSSITIPSGVTYIGEDLLYGCTGIHSIVYDGTMSQWNAITKGDDWYGGVYHTKVVKCSDGDVSIYD